MPSAGPGGEEMRLWPADLLSTHFLLSHLTPGAFLGAGVQQCGSKSGAHPVGWTASEGVGQTGSEAVRMHIWK